MKKDLTTEQNLLGLHAARINALNEQCEYHQGQAVIFAARTGAELNKAKEQLKHGEFLPWLAKNCQLKNSQAYNYMKLSIEYPQYLDNQISISSGNLPSLTQAIALLNAPETVKTEVMQKLASGETVTAKEIQAAKTEAEKHKAMADLKQKQVETLANDKIDLQQRLEQLNKNYELQSKDTDKAVKALSELEISIDVKAEAVAEEKLKIKTTELEATLNAKVATVESEYQQTIDSQQDTIDSLTSRIKGIEQTSCTTEKDKELLADLRTQIDQAHAALQTLTIDQKEAHAAKRANHAYTGIAKALSEDVHDYIENMNSISHLVDNNGNAIPLYPLTDDSKDFLQEVSRVLRNAATFIDNLAMN